MTQKIIPKLIAVTPHVIYLQRVHTTFDAMRASVKGLSYTPIQFGGILGQQKLQESSEVLEITEFEIT